jgi:hypothetical protein
MAAGFGGLEPGRGMALVLICGSFFPNGAHRLMIAADFLLSNKTLFGRMVSLKFTASF